MALEPFPRLLVFDLDGTLIDSRIDLCNSVNATLTHFGKSELPEAVISSYIGDGASLLIRRAFGDPEGDIHDEEYVTEALTFFLDYYRIHKFDYTLLYPGILESLTSIRTAHPEILMAVLTNKPVNPSRDICTYFGLAPFFFQNYGGNSFHTKKPDPHGLETLIAEATTITGRPITSAETIMIGDTDTDVLTARNCGARSIGCTFGLKPHSLAEAPPDYLAHTATDWLQILGINPKPTAPSQTV
ncbi:MAG TPA: HAD hydrolase-like protein [Edaphobacter sp.]|jgi:phosphoglycolate phosphatase|nr:HAD hydrolase-like protein [Edaphobacter sp.]